MDHQAAACDMQYYFLGIGIIITLFAVWFTAQHIHLYFMGQRASGEVVDVEERLRFSGDRNKKIYFHAVIEFTDAEGNGFRFTHGYGSTRRKPEIGSRLPVLFFDPTKARVNSFMGMWAGPLAAIILGAGCLYAGLSL